MFFRILIILQKNKHHIAFVLSVIISFTLIYFSPSSKYNYFRQSINVITNYIKAPFSKISELAQAELENEILREQVLLLSLENESLLTQGMENDRLKELLDLKQKLQYNIFPAKVINRGLITSLVAVTINCGSNDGVKKNNPVITPNGVIGKIYSVSEKTSIVQLISDTEFRVGVRFIPSAETGILRWKANSICEVREVYKNSKISVGDKVITSGLSDIFPEGLPIGTVSSVINNRSQFQKVVSVKIDERLNDITYLFVIIGEISK